MSDDERLTERFEQIERNRTYEEAKEPKSEEIHFPDGCCPECGLMLHWNQWESQWEFSDSGWWDCLNAYCGNSIFYMGE